MALVHELFDTPSYVVSVWSGFLFLCVLGIGCVILFWHSLGLPYNYFRPALQALSFCRSLEYLVNALNNSINARCMIAGLCAVEDPLPPM